jgi:hypothetical protein
MKVIFITTISNVSTQRMVFAPYIGNVQNAVREELNASLGQVYYHLSSIIYHL